MQSLRDLPSVDEVLRRLHPLDGVPREVIVEEIRGELTRRREAFRNQQSFESSVEEAVTQRLEVLFNLELRRVINATGVILHTNLGRAPLTDFEPVTGYSNLEYDLESGARGKRDDQIAPLLERLLGKPAIAVNNNAAAVYLVLNELAAGGEVIVSRGELIEIGDGFRIPEIMQRSGAILREVGTTNRTRITDYREAIADRTRLIMRVHPSNFHLQGFTARPDLKDLTALARERGIPVYEDLGSGCLLDLRGQGIKEPLVEDSVSAGVSLVSFSCDKLLGGPQAGIIAGEGDLVQRLRRNPMYRAFRVDKLTIQALQTTLRYLLRGEWNAIPALRMIFAPVAELRARAERIGAQIHGLALRIIETESAIGGGSTPNQTLPTCALELDVPDAEIFQRRLRGAKVPLIGRIERDRIILDMRTVSDSEEPLVVSAIHSALQSS